MFFIFDSITDRYRTQKIYDRVNSTNLFLIVYCPDKYITQRMCDKAVNDCLAALKFFPDCFLTRQKLESFDNALQTNDDILFYNRDFDKATFIANQIHILPAYVDKINLHNDHNFYEDDPHTIIHVRLLASRSYFEKRKALKKS